MKTRNRQVSATRDQRAVAIRRIARSNPRVDKKVVEDSLALIDFIRSAGFKARGYSIIGSSESRLKIYPPIIYKI